MASNSDRVRVQFDFSPEAYGRLEELQRLLYAKRMAAGIPQVGLPTMADVVRTFLRYADEVLGMQPGDQLVFDYQNRKPSIAVPFDLLIRPN
jgi:hypothetical protein